MAENDIHVPNANETEVFWEWLRKRGERAQQQPLAEAVLELPIPSSFPPKSEDDSSKDIWTEIDYTIYTF